MTQSRRMSLVETVTGLAVGFIVSLILTATILPAYGYAVTAGHAVEITAVFTVASFLRGYLVRRWFVWWGAR